ncbi:hypothetical protein Scep_012446 [Stephania cephalantha]|uniref:Uncharacterized protein n=1 Tax=Stephania cephalantha TaxID=152367 RepID=A0AAP0JGW2_9MAGN
MEREEEEREDDDDRWLPARPRRTSSSRRRLDRLVGAAATRRPRKVSSGGDRARPVSQQHDGEIGGGRQHRPAVLAAVAERQREGGGRPARRWRTASAEVGSGGDRTSSSVAVQRESMAGDVDAGEGLDGRQRRGSNDAGSGIARQRGRRGGSDERVGSAAKARELGAGDRPAVAPVIGSAGEAARWRVVDRSDARFRRNRDDAMEGLKSRVSGAQIETRATF